LVLDRSSIFLWLSLSSVAVFFLGKELPSWSFGGPNIYIYIGANSGFTMSVLVGFLSQFYARRYHPHWWVNEPTNIPGGMPVYWCPAPIALGSIAPIMCSAPLWMEAHK
jgi:hypothetical protein